MGDEGRDLAPPLVEQSPGLIEQKPPPSWEREHKTDPKKTMGLAFAAKAMGIAGSYTEYDDFVRGLYYGLPWQLRRWKGRDGVWRDRDYLSHKRMERLFKEWRHWKFGAALTALARNEAIDQFGRLIGMANKDAIIAAGKYYRGLLGLTGRTLGRGPGSASDVHYELMKKVRASRAQSRERAYAQAMREERFRRGLPLDGTRMQWRRRYTDPLSPSSGFEWERRAISPRTDLTEIPWLKNVTRRDRNYRAARGTVEFWDASTPIRNDGRMTIVNRPYVYYAPGRGMAPR